MSATAQSEAWVDLAMEAWETNPNRKIRGRKRVESAARAKFEGLAADRRHNVYTLVSSWSAARDALDVAYKAVGDPEIPQNAENLTAHITRLEEAITTSQAVRDALTALLVRRDVIPDTDGRVVQHVERLFQQAKDDYDEPIESRVQAQQDLEVVQNSAEGRGESIIDARSNSQSEQQIAAQTGKKAQLRQNESGRANNDTEGEQNGGRSGAEHENQAQSTGAQPADNNVDRSRAGNSEDQPPPIPAMPPPPPPLLSPVSPGSVRRAKGLLGVGWAGPKLISGTNQSKCEIYVKQNSHGTIVDLSLRIVVKDTAAGQADAFKYADVGGIQMPVEVAAMHMLKQLIGSECIVQMRNWRMYPSTVPHLDYRIYMEYCGRGDLFDFERPYYQFVSQDAECQLPPENGIWIPEPFLWAVFHTLVAGGLLMERGDGDYLKAGAWHTIVHGDLKLANVFLAENTSNFYRGYPQPKIADFGESLMIASEDIRQPEQLFENEGIGTYNARAPEQTVRIGSSQEALPRSSTNVWGIGFVLWSLVHGKETDKLLHDFEADGDGQAKKKPATFNDGARQQYSRQLLAAIEHCLAYDAAARPSCADLMHTIRRNTGHGRHDRARGLRDADSKDRRFVKYGVAPQSDKWPLHTPLVAAPEAGKLGRFDPPPRRRNRRDRRAVDSETESDDSGEDDDDDDLGGNAGDILSFSTDEGSERGLDESGVTGQSRKRPAADGIAPSTPTKRAMTDRQDRVPSGGTHFSPSTPPETAQLHSQQHNPRGSSDLPSPTYSITSSRRTSNAS
ncbi:hypothetical protein CLAFUR0_14458 [Fulvia fulva]|nr:hypothetical protein CLAFUR0_14458 [Fulvia fulva]